MRSGGALKLYILLSFSGPREPNPREFTRVCDLELYLFSVGFCEAACGCFGPSNLILVHGGLRSGGALELHILLSFSEPREPNPCEFTRDCALELYFSKALDA